MSVNGTLNKNLRNWLSLFCGFLCCFLCLVPSLSAQVYTNSPKAVDGVLDLREWDFHKDGYATLDGQWEFYWQQLLYSDDFTADSAPRMTGFLQVPGSWNKLKIDNESIPTDGFATYRLKVLLKDAEQHLLFRIEPVNSAYQFYINGELMAAAGTLGKSEQDSAAAFSMERINYYAGAQTLELIVHVSNFRHRRGGIAHPMQFGHQASVVGLNDFRLAVVLFSSGCLFIMAVYHLFVYVTRRKDISPLYFGSFCFVIAIRVVAQTGYLWQVFPGASWDLRLNTDYLTFYLAAPLFATFIHSLFPQCFSKKVLRTLLVMSCPFVLSALVLPANVVTDTIPAFQVITLVFMSYIIYVLVKSVVRKLEGALLFLVAFMVFFAGIVNDILFFSGLIQTIPVGPFTMLLFMVSQAFLLSLKSSNAFAKNEKLTASYERFVPHEFLSQLGKEEIIDVKLGDCVRVSEMSILFSDIRSFTTLSESMTPEQTFKFLNAYLKHMEPSITENHGVVDKFIGDAIMALFPKSADNGVKAAIAMHKALITFNEERLRSGEVPIKTGIGINTGPMMLGTIGADNRMEGTVISDAVNLAARLEGMTKQYGAAILISETTLACLREPQEFSLRIADKVIVKGKTEPVTVWEVLDGDSDEVRHLKQSYLLDFERGIEMYYQQQFYHGAECFERCLEIFPGDKIAAIFLERCNNYRHTVFADDWDGVERLETK